MNRLLLESSEITGDTAVFTGERAEHILKVLHGEVGQTLKTGEIGGRIGLSTITAIDKALVTVSVNHDAEPLPSWVDLILAPPRPRVMKRLLPQLSTLGVGRIVLVGAGKVEKDFWGATLLKEENYRPLLIDGLMQGAVSTELPLLTVRRNFRAFLRDELETMFPGTRRLVAHPLKDGDEGVKTPERPLPEDGRRLVLAVGPEGGWTDDEVARLEACGFDRYSLGRRILRTDTALIALLAQLMEK